MLDMNVIFTGLCTLLGTLGGIMASAKLISYRIEQLEKKVDKHNSVVERVFILEGRVDHQEVEINDLKQANHSASST